MPAGDSGLLSTLPQADKGLEPQGVGVLFRGPWWQVTLSIPGPHTVLGTEWCPLSLVLQGHPPPSFLPPGLPLPGLPTLP